MGLTSDERGEPLAALMLFEAQRTKLRRGPPPLTPALEKAYAVARRLQRRVRRSIPVAPQEKDGPVSINPQLWTYPPIVPADGKQYCNTEYTKRYGSSIDDQQ